jgi:hypothetical protein
MTYLSRLAFIKTSQPLAWQLEGARASGKDRRHGLAVERGQACRASAHAKNAKYARRDRGVRVASRKQRGRHARAQAQAHYKREEGRDTRRALATSSSVQRGLFRRTFEGALGAAQRWTPEQLCFRRSKAGGIVTSLRMH